MWSDNDIDTAFRRLDPAESDPTPFPLDAWLKLEAGLDQAVIDRAVRHRLWQFFAAEVAVVALVGLGWALWPAGSPAAVASKAKPAATTPLPVNKAAAAKRIKGSAASVPNIATVPTARTAAANPTPAMPGTMQSVPAPAPVSATNAAAVPTGSARHGAARGGLHSPLAVALASGLRFHLASGQVAVLDKGAAEPNSGRPENPSMTGKAPASGASTSGTARAKIAVQLESRIRTEAVSNASGSRTAASSLDAREAGITSTALPGSSERGGELAAASAPATSEQNAHTASTSPDGSTETAVTATSRPSDATTAPLAAMPVALAQPAAAPLPALLALADQVPAPLPAVVHQPHFYVGVVAAPDVSTVKFASVQRPLLNVGVTLEYRLTNRLLLTTGVLRSVKKYSARRDDYNWGAYKSVVYSHDFQDVDGTCTVLDIPLNLRYDLLWQPAYRVFGSLGLSSFFMQHEFYSYDYVENNMLKQWSGRADNQNRHLLSILNLSAGYERSLGPHWRLQAEPYVKVPLAGVGAGQVKLLSAGVYFGVKYGF